MDNAYTNIVQGIADELGLDFATVNQAVEGQFRVAKEILYKGEEDVKFIYLGKFERREESNGR